VTIASKRLCLDEGAHPPPPPPHGEQILDLPMMVGGSHQQASLPRQRRGVGHHHTAQKPFPDSPMVGNTHWQVSMLGRAGCQLLPHCEEPFTDEATTVGGVHWQAFVPSWTLVPTAATPHRAVEGGGRFRTKELKSMKPVA